jgi:membrane protein DedA with SNARE-associated domain
VPGPAGISSSSFAIEAITRRSETAAGPEELWTRRQLQSLARYGLVIIPALVVAEQFGIPLPAVPALLGVGALAAAGQVSIPLVLGTIAAVALSVDFVGYELGRRRGADVLAKLCRTSPELDSCVRRAKNVFARYGAGAMLVAKFVLGLTAVMPPLAGVVAIGRGRFALYELSGVLLWAGTWIGRGYFFSDAISSIALRAARLGRVLGVVVVAAVGAYVLVKYLRRRLPLASRRRSNRRGEPPAIKMHHWPAGRMPHSSFLTAGLVDEMEVSVVPMLSAVRWRRQSAWARARVDRGRAECNPPQVCKALRGDTT